MSENKLKCWYLGCQKDITKMRGKSSLVEYRKGREMKLKFCSEGCVHAYQESKIKTFTCIVCERETTTTRKFWLNNDFQNTCHSCTRRCRMERNRLF